MSIFSIMGLSISHSETMFVPDMIASGCVRLSHRYLLFVCRTDRCILKERSGLIIYDIGIIHCIHDAIGLSFEGCAVQERGKV
jgi:hypothetical protein